MVVPLKRENEKQFSTFVNIVDDNFGSWIEDRSLKRSMDRQQSLFPKDLETSFPVNAWVTHWHQTWKQQQAKLPRYHLYAYLQEPCYWSAQKISSRFNTTSFGLADCFQAAFEKSDKVLQGFDPGLGPSLSTYAGRAFSNAIHDALANNQEVQIASELSLLQRCTRKRLGKALAVAGLSEDLQAINQAAWQSFKDFYFPKTTAAKTLDSLAPEDWVAMLAKYDLLREQQNLPKASEALLQEWLGKCVLHLRHYTAPRPISLNASMDDCGELIDTLQDGSEASMTQLMAQELEATQQKQQQKINAVLQSGLSKLNPAHQQLLQFYYGDQLTQQEIAVQLKSKQYKVSRQLRAARKALLTVLVTWIQDELHMSCKATVLNSMTANLDGWLKVQFSGEHNQHVDV